MQFPPTPGETDAGTLTVAKAETTTAVSPSVWTGPDLNGTGASVARTNCVRY